ncbi:MAG: hypothetical protein LQ352_008142, partial [Teloschistes flavicans]
MNGHRPLRIAILECDTGLPKALAKYKRYGAISSVLLESGAEAAGLRHGDVEISLWDVVNNVGEFPELGDVDGVFLTGSIGYVKEVLAQDRVRLVGVCFGHQIIGRAMGARVGRNENQGWEVSVTDVDLTAEGKHLFDGRGILSIYQMHKDIVFDHPPGVQALGSTGRCKVQGMFVPGRLLTVQGHPEFTEEILVEILEVRHEQGVFGDEIYEEAMARVGKKHDGLM